ncbi:SNF2 family DNA or RNA helicase [Streptomyces sp. V3I8]|uniref:SNF2-related protein n=1 Tax=Streptomyces sp. V3I8 TaxID=3042279 RepID=UPI002787C803|nr:DEAD/DEAH box helicase [Streptomyces sp. V3I8]MDQ1041419.1 SNF2 family DNA or RNA helicase [Streptomyces sp. V3I8]
MAPTFSSPHGLFPCQQEGVGFAYLQRSGLMVADTGIGKSVMALALGALLSDEGGEDLVLLVCKTNKLSEWAEDFAAFTTLSHRVHHGPNRHKQLARHGLPHALISTFETLRTDLVDFGVKPGKRATTASDAPLLQALLQAQADGRRVLVVYDEISDKLRNRSSRMYKAHWYALNRLRKAQPDMRAIGLTATPMAKSYEDGFNLLRLLVPDAMPTVKEFEGVVIKSRDDYGRPRYDQLGVSWFVELAQQHMWRKRKTDPDVRGLFPARIEEFRTLQMNRDQQHLYDVVTSLQDGIDTPVPGLWTALRQIAAHPAALIHSATHGESQMARALVGQLGEEYLRSVSSRKTEELVEYLSPIIHGQGDKAVVFSQFGPSVLPLLAAALLKEGIRSYLYVGSMNTAERERARQAFRADGSPCVFLTSDAGKDGINLPEATYLVEYESALTYETRTQRLGRIDRISSTAASITCTTFVLQGTVENGIVDTMLERNEMADRFLGDTGAEGHVGAVQRRASLLFA